MNKLKIIRYIITSSIVLIIVIVIAGTSRYVVKPLVKGWPLTVEQAANKVIKGMDPESLRQLKKMKKEDLISLHMGFGQGIRNEFGLWQGNALLLRDSGAHHPDDASMVIIEVAWEKLQ